MTPDLDIADDFASVVDGLQSVVIDGGHATEALMRGVTTIEAAKSGGRYTTSDTVLHLDANKYPQRPRLGARVVDAGGETWVVIEAAKQTLANRWRCVCRQLRIDPADLVIIQKATHTKGESGALQADWATVAVDVPARVVIDAIEVDAVHQSRVKKASAIVYFTSEQELTPQHRILHGGMVLKVVQWSGFDAIKSLFECKCEVSQWPS